MFNMMAMAASLLLIPVQYGPQFGGPPAYRSSPYGNGAPYSGNTVPGDAGCEVTTTTPEVEVTAERNDPTYSYSESTTGLTQKSTNGGSYRPPGATGPAWHTGGLTQGMFTYKRNIPYQMITVSNGLNCLSVQSIKFQIVLTPQVWVANDYPPGTCMFNAVHDHEMKHVNVDRIVTDRHLPQIRAALSRFSQGRGFFGPGSRDQIKGEFDQFVQQLDDVLKDQIDAMSQEDTRAQQAVDTLQEYQRISNLCSQQLRETR